MSTHDPEWEDPAQLDGLPYTNWKRRAGYTETGTLAQMVERWLSVPWHVQACCHLSWSRDGKLIGSAHANGIGALVVRKGLPPAMLKGRSRPPTREEIERKFTKPILREGPPVHQKSYCPNPHATPKESDQ